jgi:hypothetical protein
MHDAKGIAIYCPNSDCPVFDKADDYKTKKQIAAARKEMKKHASRIFLKKHTKELKDVN